MIQETFMVLSASDVMEVICGVDQLRYLITSTSLPRYFALFANQTYDRVYLEFEFATELVNGNFRISKLIIADFDLKLICTTAFL